MCVLQICLGVCVLVRLYVHVSVRLHIYMSVRMCLCLCAHIYTGHNRIPEHIACLLPRLHAPVWLFSLAPLLSYFFPSLLRFLSSSLPPSSLRFLSSFLSPSSSLRFHSSFLPPSSFPSILSYSFYSRISFPPSIPPSPSPILLKILSNK